MAAKTYAASARTAVGAVASAAQRLTIESIATLCALWSVYGPCTIPGWLVRFLLCRARLLSAENGVTSGAAAPGRPSQGFYMTEIAPARPALPGGGRFEDSAVCCCGVEGAKVGPANSSMGAIEAIWPRC